MPVHMGCVLNYLVVDYDDFYNWFSNNVEKQKEEKQK